MAGVAAGAVGDGLAGAGWKKYALWVNSVLSEEAKIRVF